MVDVYFDGASAGNPGLSGAGIFINFKNGKVEEHAIPLLSMSNHEAEYEAFLFALKRCRELNLSNVSFRTDSQLIDDAVERKHVKNALYKPYLEEALALIDQFDLFYLKWVPSKANGNADRLAKQGIAIQKKKR
ncbi:reverse transcriptase-like protein [Alkalihalobacillus sp. FSL R5-0424]